MQGSTPKSLRKYQIGLAMLGLVTIGLFIFVIMQGQAVRADAATTTAAQKAATAIENYTSSKGTIPASLSVVGDTSAPDSISYTRLSDTSYKFCITYKSASGFSSSDVTNRVLSSTYGGAASSSTDSTSSSYLSITSSHKKGQNCQTIKPYLYSSYSSYNSTSSSSSLSDPAAVCDAQYKKDKNATTYTTCIEKASNYGGSSSSSAGSGSTDLYAKCDKLYPNASQDKEYYACIGGSNSPATSGSLRPRVH